MNRYAVRRLKLVLSHLTKSSLHFRHYRAAKRRYCRLTSANVGPLIICEHPLILACASYAYKEMESKKTRAAVSAGNVRRDAVILAG